MLLKVNSDRDFFFRENEKFVGNFAATIVHVMNSQAILNLQGVKDIPDVPSGHN